MVSLSRPDGFAAFGILRLVGHIVCVTCLSFGAISCRFAAISFEQAAEDPLVSRDGLVVAYHSQAREIGQKILAAGGNAADAFVATVVSENVLAEGASSLAGSLAALLYLPGTTPAGGSTIYLDADFNDPFDPNHRWSRRTRDKGKAVLVPGAPRGLYALWEKYGVLKFSELLEPAIALAEDGFPVSRVMAVFLKYRSRTLDDTEYGRRTFFRDGKPLRRQDILRQPEAAEFLRRFAREGPNYVYCGDWGREFIDTVRSYGGLLSAEDLSRYDVRWHAPVTATYRGTTIHGSSGYSYGGLWVLLALKAWEQAGSPAGSPYWTDADRLEEMIRVARQVWSETWLFDVGTLADRDLIQSYLTEQHASELWRRVSNREPAHPLGAGKSHSYHIIVVDRNGMIVSGTTTINSGPWGDGIFVRGLPLTTAGSIAWSTKPGERRLGAFTMHFVFRDGRPRFATGCISNSLVETGFQTIVKLIDYGMPPREAASTPRFGTFPINDKIQLDRNALDPRVESDIVRVLKSRKLKVVQKGLIDTGLGAIVALRDDGAWEGLTMPIPYISRPFESTP